MRTRQGFSSVNPLLLARHDASLSSNGLSSYLSSANAFASLQLKTSGGTARLSISGSVSLDDDREHLIGLQFSQISGATGAVWVDGRLAASGTNSGAWAFASQEVRFGLGLDAFWNIFGGAAGNIRWYNRTLSADEHRELYLNPYAGFAEDDYGALTIPAGGGGGIGGSGSIFASPIFNSRVVRGRGLTH